MSNLKFKKITAIELKNKFIEYFKSKGHTVVPNSSLIPENDPSALFINSGMHPLIPYLLGEPHPFGKTKRLTNVQRCVRTVDIDNIGNSLRHNTFFEMLGEWSLGDYWKKESLEYSIEFLVEVLGFDVNRLYATVYIGDEIVPRDNEAIEIWKIIYKKYGIEPTIGENFSLQNSPKIIMLKEDNFWTVGGYGPCGPTSEIYYDRGYGEDVDVRFLEVVNNVFMAYFLEKDGTLSKLEQQNIDVGWGLERLLSILWNMEENGNLPLSASVYDTDAFYKQRDLILKELNKTLEEYFSDKKLQKAIRLILDHTRSGLMMIADGIQPSNKDQGYVLRRLIRRAVTFGNLINLQNKAYEKLLFSFSEHLSSDPEYELLFKNINSINSIFIEEVNKFNKVLNTGIKEISKIKGTVISGEIAFRLKESHGIPIEILTELAEKQNLKIDLNTYEKLLEEHQQKSRTATKGKFVGGLGDHSPEAIAYHTVAHLLLAELRKNFGDTVVQKGQNITQERLRYDFAFTRALTREELEKLEVSLNILISDDLIVDMIEVPYEESKKMGVVGMFHDKYKDKDNVKLYRIYKDSVNPDNVAELTSIEYCGGPHVNRTSEISKFGKVKIQKEEASGSGVRRIKIIFAK